MEKLPTNATPGQRQGSCPETGTAWTPSIGPREVWARDEIRQACARRDVSHVYTMLNAAGVSQRQLAAATGQSQSEISEILCRRRVVGHVGVLARIADGLGVPRGWWGLAHTPSTVDDANPDTEMPSGGA